MAKPNYSFEKRQRELAKKRKKEEKAQRKTAPGRTDDAGEPAEEGTQADDSGAAAAPGPAEPSPT